ncbi:hypothetical protein BsWGS_17392 [Bradybaena similaris]
MAALIILIVSMVTLAQSALIPNPLASLGPVYVPANKPPTNAANVQPGAATILAIPLSVVATSDDDIKTPLETVKDAVANVAEKVADVVDNVREKVADVVDDVRDKVSDFVDDAKAGGSSRRDVGVISKAKDNSNETSDTSDEVDKIDDNSEELKSDGGNSTEGSITDDDSKDKDKKVNEDDDDSKNKLNTGKSSAEVRTRAYNRGKQTDDSKEKVSGTDNSSNVNGTDDSGEKQDVGKKDIVDNNNDDDSREKGETKSMWSWLKGLIGDIENESGDGDTKVRHYLTQISKVRGYLDAMDSNFAASVAKQSGTCPVYPVQVGNNRVTITTQNGCKIIIRLKGLTVDKIEDGHEDKKRTHKRSVLVSYSDD